MNEYPPRSVPRDVGGRRRFRRPYVVVAVLLSVLVTLAGLYRSALYARVSSLAVFPGQQLWKSVVPANLTVGTCWPLDADPRIHFNLPLSSEGFFVISRGAYATGDVHISQSGAHTATVRVQVEAPIQTDLVKICAVTDLDRGFDGLGIFTPERVDAPEHSPVALNVKIILPDQGPYLQLPMMRVDMPLFTFLAFEDLTKIIFTVLEVVSERLAVVSKGLVADVCSMATAHGSITGVFKTASILHLESGDEIKIIGEVVDADRGKPSSVTLTSLASTSASVTLSSTAAPFGAYIVEAASSAASIFLDFPTAPELSSLNVKAVASHNVTLSLHEYYQGPFKLTNYHGNNFVEQDEEVEKKRGRTVDAKKSEIITYGKISGLKSSSQAASSDVFLKTLSTGVTELYL